MFDGHFALLDELRIGHGGVQKGVVDHFGN
jgi:hypothetical protein